MYDSKAFPSDIQSIQERVSNLEAVSYRIGPYRLIQTLCRGTGVVGVTDDAEVTNNMVITDVTHVTDIADITNDVGVTDDVVGTDVVGITDIVGVPADRHQGRYCPT